MFRRAKIKKISSGAVKENEASCKIFEKLGFTKLRDVEKASLYTFYDGMLTFSEYELKSEDYFKNESN